MTVTATGGTSARALTADHAITITVNDVNEPPPAPAAPTVSAVPGESDRLSVTWTRPDSTGIPSSFTYDLRYRKGTSGDFTDDPGAKMVTFAAIGGLEENSAYEVQVRARNDEGVSPWSSAGTGSTNPRTASNAYFVDGPDSGTYAIDERISVAVLFSAAVTVSGTPQVALDIGGKIRQADYESGSGTESLLFSYTVAEDDEATDGILVPANSLTLNGGTIMSDGLAASIDLSNYSFRGALVDGVRPVFMSAETSVDGTRLFVTFSEPISKVDVTSLGLSADVGLALIMIDGAVVELCPAVAIAHGTTWTMSLQFNAVQDLAGNANAVSNNHPITNNVPDVPTDPTDACNFIATAHTGKIRLEWTGSADAYEFRRKEGNGDWGTWTAAETRGWFVLRNATTLDDYDVLALTEYTYQVRVVGTSNNLGEVSATLGASITLRLGATEYRVDEGAGALFFTVLVETPAGLERYDRAIRPSFTSAGVPGPFSSPFTFVKTQEDYELRSESLRIQPGDFVMENGRYVASRRRSIGIFDDTLVEGDETFELRLLLGGGVSRFFTLGAGNGRAEVTIVDNDD